MKKSTQLVAVAALVLALVCSAAEQGDEGGDVYNSLGNSTPPASKCNAHQRFKWVYVDFKECVKTNLQLAGFILGLVSNICWLIAQGPQMYLNYKNGAAEGLSLLFLAEWLTGDITNLVGCILTHQVQTQLFTAIYFCIIDSMMLAQTLYYNSKNKAAKSSTRIQTAMAPVVLMVAVPAIAVGLFGLPNMVGGEAAGFDGQPAVHHHPGRTLLMAAGNSTGDDDDADDDNFSNPRILIGYIFGWVSGLLYFTSRIPQIVKNFKRKTCEGLSPIMFGMAVLGNLFYGCGVLMENQETTFIIGHLPWLLGSIGTLIFDFTILVQYFVYGTPKAVVPTYYEGDSSEEKPLIYND